MHEVLFIFLIGCAVVVVSSSDNVEKTPEIMSEKDIRQVQQHYVKYPYPPYVDIHNEVPQIIIHPQMEELNHFIFGGKGDLGRKKPFRILIAGGGTGNSLLHYAYLFRNLEASIVYLDFSIKSLEISKKRMKPLAYFKNITFIHNSIYNIPQLNLGLFDFIDCYGVLHHLPDPDEGLQILKDSLAPNGGMMFMLYAYYGRQGVYDIQDTIKILNRNRTLSLEEEVSRGRILFQNLNFYSRGLRGGIFNEVKDDAGFYDLYLHKQDKAFTIPELYSFIEGKGGLQIISFSDQQSREVLHEASNILLEQGNKKFALNEMLSGSEVKQVVFVSKSRNESEASVDEMDNVPFFVFKNSMALLDATPEEGSFKNYFIKVHLKNNYKRNVLIPLSKYTNTFFKLIRFDKYTIGEIANYCTQKNISKSKDSENLRRKVLKQLKKTLKNLILHGIVLLRHKSTPPIELLSGIFYTIESVNLVKI